MKENEYKEYNALTKRLLAEGYTADRHPDHVRVDVSTWEKKTLDNFYGGFTYERSMSRPLRLPAACSVKASSVTAT